MSERHLVLVGELDDGMRCLVQVWLTDAVVVQAEVCLRPPTAGVWPAPTPLRLEYDRRTDAVPVKSLRMQPTRETMTS